MAIGKVDQQRQPHCMGGVYCIMDWETYSTETLRETLRRVILLFLGACLPLLVTLLSWRLAMLIPSQKPSREGRKVKKAEKNFHLKESNSLQYFSPGKSNKLCDLWWFHVVYNTVKSPVFQLGDLSSPYSASGPAMTSSTNTTPSMSTEQLPVPLQGEVLYWTHNVGTCSWYLLKPVH